MGNDKQFTILCGKSSVGKDSVLQCLVDKYNYTPIISYTTRPIRSGEKDGREYVFVSKKEFELMIKNDMFIEYRSYNTLFNGNNDVWHYGTMKDDELNENNKYIIILDLNGAQKFIEYYGRNNCNVIYIDCNDNTRMERAKKRGSFSIEEWNRRLKADKEDFEYLKRLSLVDKEILNENKTIEKVAKEIVNE